MVVFSFHPVKTVTSAEGGIVTTRDPELYERLLEFRAHGTVRDPGQLTRSDEGGWYMEQQALGSNYRLSDVHSALGIFQLAKLDRFLERRNEIAARYRSGLAELDQLTLAPEAGLAERRGRHLYVVVHRDGPPASRQLYDGLCEREIFAQVHYLPVYLHPYYRGTYGYEPGLCPNAESYYAGCVSLRCYPTLTHEQQNMVIASVRELA
jgi:dTDP-4-amino-4,6-dideoxygalactose transaminase